MQPATQKTLGIDMGGMPPLGTQYAAAMKDNTAAMGELEQAQRQQSQAHAAGAEKLKGMEAQSPAVPEQSPLPEKFEHHGLNDQQMNESIQSMFALAAIGGMMTRAPVTAALQAFSGGLKGLVDGDKMVFARETAEFDRNLKTAIAKNQQAVQKYNMAFKKHQGDLNAAMREIQLEATAHQDTVTAALAKANNAQGVMKHIESMQRAEQMATRQHDQLMLQLKRMESQDARFNASQAGKGWQVFQDPKTGQLVRVNAVSGEVAPVDYSALQKPGAPGKGGGSASGDTRSKLVSGASKNALNRLDEIKKDSGGNYPNTSVAFGTHADSLTGRIGEAGVNMLMSDEQQKVDARYASLIDEAIPVFTGGLRGSDAFRKFLLGQVPQPGQSQDAANEKMRLFEENIKGMRDDFTKAFRSNPSFQAGEAPAASPAPAGGGWSIEPVKD